MKRKFKQKSLLLQWHMTSTNYIIKFRIIEQERSFTVNFLLKKNTTE